MQMERRGAGFAPAPSDSLGPDSRISIPNHVVHRQFPMQTVVLDLQTGTYHGLTADAGPMLCALERARNLRGAALELAKRAGITRAEAETRLCELCTQLLDRGLIELC